LRFFTRINAANFTYYVLMETKNPNDIDNETPQKDHKQELLEKIELFKQEIARHRFDVKMMSDEEFTKLNDDETYKVLVAKGDLTIGDDELENLAYPYRKTRRQKEQEEAERKRKEELAKQGFNWGGSEEKSFIRENFNRDREEFADDPLATNSNTQKTRIVPKDLKTQYLEYLEQPRKDFEQLVGENLISKLGILLITIGVITLLNIADVNWYINDTIKSLLVFGIGVAMLYLTHRLRQSNVTFSGLFAYGAVAIFYYSIDTAEYDGIINKPFAFFLGSLTTLLTLSLAILYDRRSLAVLALFGAYLMPYTVNADEDFSNTLFFSYLLFMNVLMAAVANYKQWQFINASIFVLTVITFDGWIHLPSTDLLNNGIFSVAVTFAVLYYIFFWAIYVAYTIKHGEQFYFPIVINTVLFVYTMIRLLYEHETLKDDSGMALIMMGLLNAIFATGLIRKGGFDDRLVDHAVGFGVILVSLGIFVESSYLQLNRFWTIEALVLMGLGYYANLQWLRNSSAVLMLIGGFMVFANWFHTYSQPSPTLFFNPAVYSTIITIITSVGAILILNKDREAKQIIAVRKQLYMAVLGGLAGFLLYMIGNVELSFHQYEVKEIKRLWIGIYNSLFILGIWLIGQRLKVPVMQKVADYLVAVSAFSYMLIVHFSVLDLRNEYLMQNQSFWAFALHYINVILGVAMVVMLITDLYKRYGEKNPAFTYATWFVAVVLLFHISAEMEHTAAIVFYEAGKDLDDILWGVRMLGYSIVWALCSAALMIYGMRLKIKEMRLIALAIFGLTIIKFFALDFRHIGLFAKVFALIFLGVLLLGVSFMYGKLRKMLLEQEVNPDALRQRFNQSSTFEAPEREDPEQPI